MAMSTFRQGAVLLALVTLAAAQYGPPSGSGYTGGNPYANGGDGDGNGNSGSSGFGRGGFGGARGNASTIITAHAVLGSLAFVLFFPLGGILIRVASFPKLWLAHAGLQIVAWIFYIIAFGIGVWMTVNYYTFKSAHPIIGIVLFVLLAFQPALGFVHHIMFKKHSRRVVWSYGHIWLGRITILGGIINGGLGLRLAQQTRFQAPSTGAVAGYAVAAAIMGGAYLASIIYGERKRSKAAKGSQAPYKEVSRNDYSRNDYEMGSPGHNATRSGAPEGVGEYYKQQKSGQTYA
ncbi:hypothetical protein B0A48_10375 [Cryoendolithus antarcticus]|uniref:Cytochrome b561 domain-containing protein n=1 Tax=Cryoendolithus antarcticus TaxID=1507870 RepID=A0A1V8SXC1_9PEZI|nr:hypothetical protein B0A48_10375 [Cryoendolithus antarcticus]